MTDQTPTLEVTVYNDLRGQLASLKQLSAEKKFDYEDADGNKAARSHVWKLRRSKAAVEVIRKDSKAASIAYGKRVDAEAGDIRAEIQTMIEVHTGPLEAIEEREENRVAGYALAIESMREMVRDVTENWMTNDLEIMRLCLSEGERGSIDPESWEEFYDEARAVKAEEIQT